jgi:hypothetical protein
MPKNVMFEKNNDCVTEDSNYFLRKNTVHPRIKPISIETYFKDPALLP